MKIYNIFNTFLSENMDENRKKALKITFCQVKTLKKVIKNRFFTKKVSILWCFLLKTLTK